MCQIRRQTLGPPLIYDRIGDFNFPKLDEIPTFNWQAWSTNEIIDGSYPHMKASIITGVEGDDRLLRGEILAIIDIMSTRLKTKSLHPHVVAPVRCPGFPERNMVG